MNKTIRELAEQAEFMFWDGESWAPPGQNKIDWSADYSAEFDRFVAMLISDVLLNTDISKEQSEQIVKRYLA